MKKFIITSAIITTALSMNVWGANLCTNQQETISYLKSVLNCEAIDLECLVTECNPNINIQELINKLYCNNNTETSTNATTQVTTQKPIIETSTETTTKITTQATTQKPIIETTTETTTKATTQTTTQRPTQTTTQKPTTETTTEATTQSQSSYAQEVLNLVNKHRKENGLSTLKLNSSVSKVAQAKAEDMKNKNYFSHTSPTYGSPFDMLQSFGVSYKTAGENIAKGQKTPEAVVNAWMNSEGHRANILNPSFTSLGVGYTKGSSTYWVQMFIG